jgi:hypothetical protein
MRTDLIAIPGTPQSEVWGFLWGYIELADVFILSRLLRTNLVPQIEYYSEALDI